MMGNATALIPPTNSERRAGIFILEPTDQESHSHHLDRSAIPWNWQKKHEVSCHFLTDQGNRAERSYYLFNI